MAADRSAVDEGAVAVVPLALDGHAGLGVFLDGLARLQQDALGDRQHLGAQVQLFDDLPEELHQALLADVLLLLAVRGAVVVDVLGLSELGSDGLAAVSAADQAREGEVVGAGAGVVVGVQAVLYKLHLPAARYSEDIDLVQIAAAPVGPTIDALRARLDSWLGQPKRSFSEGRVTLSYRFLAEGEPPIKLKLKVEINTREHFSVFGLRQHPFAVRSRWFEGEANIKGYCLDEQLGTKLRALYQRRKGRDLFDLWDGLVRGGADPQRVVQAFGEYLDAEGHSVSRSEFEENLVAKVADGRFMQDVVSLLAPGVVWHPEEAVRLVGRELVARLPGDEWTGMPAYT